MESLSLRFKLFGFPVTIEPTFFLLGLLFYRMAGTPLGTLEVMVWVLIAIMVHELGHAFAMRQFGLAPSIRLHMIGGMAYWEKNPGAPLSNLQQIWIALAGPLAGFALGGLLWLWANYVGAIPHFALDEYQVYSYTQFFTIYWSILNLLPVYPLDGGQVLYYGLNLNPRWNARLLTGIITLAVGGTLLFLALRVQQYWVAILLGYILYKNISMLQSSRDQHLNVEVQQVLKLIQSGDFETSVPRLEGILQQAKSKPYQNWAISQLAEYYLQQQNWQKILELDTQHPGLRAAFGYPLALANQHIENEAAGLTIAQKVLDRHYEERLARYYIEALCKIEDLDRMAQFLGLSRAHKDFAALKAFTLNRLQTSGLLEALAEHPFLKRILEEDS
ncbi:MAG: site-2 protease family protein [Bacteroidota bacterium]